MNSMSVSKLHQPDVYKSEADLCIRPQESRISPLFRFSVTRTWILKSKGVQMTSYLEGRDPAFEFHKEPEYLESICNSSVR